MAFSYDPANYEATVVAAAGASIHTATTTPATSNDVSQNFYPGSRWLNTSNGTVYVCTDNTSTAAVWKQEVILGSDGSLTVTAANNKNISLTVSGTGHIILTGVPSSDPTIAGALYTATGALKVSAG